MALTWQSKTARLLRLRWHGERCKGRRRCACIKSRIGWRHLGGAPSYSFIWSNSAERDYKRHVRDSRGVTSVMCTG